MTQRFVLIMLGSASFVVTLALSAWHEGLWERSVEPRVAATQTALPAAPAPEPAARADSPRAQPEVPDPGPAAVPVPPPTDDTPAVSPDPTAPGVSDREPQERHGKGARGARTR
jgi:hypothetical protein